MRIITGKARGFKLKAPQGLDVRPTSDRVKESVFNILAGHIEQAEVLDLFAGTGNLGLEALSRGAKSAVFVDCAINSLSIIKENALHTCLGERAEYIRSDAVKAIGRLYHAGRKFDLIFCDPPYNKGHISAVITKLEQNLLLKPGGIVIVEHSKHESITTQENLLRMVRTEKYGETMITFLTTALTDVHGNNNKEDA